MQTARIGAIAGIATLLMMPSFTSAQACPASFPLGETSLSEFTIDGVYIPYYPDCLDPVAQCNAQAGCESDMVSTITVCRCTDPANASEESETTSDASRFTFVPLTDIPGFPEAGNAPDLGTFLNTVYRICIGIAAILTVLQLVRAGVMYAAGDSVSEKREARQLITLSLLGLLLVLSPAIVFRVIDPRILSLDINTAPLAVPQDSDSEGAPTTPSRSEIGNDAATCAAFDASFDTQYAGKSSAITSPQAGCCQARGCSAEQIPGARGGTGYQCDCTNPVETRTDENGQSCRVYPLGATRLNSTNSSTEAQCCNSQTSCGVGIITGRSNSGAPQCVCRDPNAEPLTFPPGRSAITANQQAACNAQASCQASSMRTSFYCNCSQ